jgi:hypothetical protein
MNRDVAALPLACRHSVSQSLVPPVLSSTILLSQLLAGTCNFDLLLQLLLSHRHTFPGVREGPLTSTSLTAEREVIYDAAKTFG